MKSKMQFYYSTICLLHACNSSLQTAHTVGTWGSCFGLPGFIISFTVNKGKGESDVSAVMSSYKVVDIQRIFNGNTAPFDSICIM